MGEGWPVWVRELFMKLCMGDDHARSWAVLSTKVVMLQGILTKGVKDKRTSAKDKQECGKDKFKVVRTKLTLVHKLMV